MPQIRDETLLRMRAAGAGFDIPMGGAGDWLVFNAAGNLATLWLSGDGATHLAAVAPAAVPAEVGEFYGVQRWNGILPVGAVAAWSCVGDVALDALCRRVAVLGHVLPDQVFRRYEAEVEAAVRAEVAQGSTEREALVRHRVGQDRFRDALMEYWGGRCAITGVSEPALLRASHAKPWKDATDRERLDVHNGLLLVAHLDAAFDVGLIGVAADGEVLVSARLGVVERRVLGVDEARRVAGLAAGHGVYLGWHREWVLLT